MDDGMNSAVGSAPDPAPKKPRKPRAAKKPAPKPKHKALITAIAALVVAATDFFLTLRYGLKLF